MNFPHTPAPERLYRAIIARVEYLRRRNAALLAGTQFVTAFVAGLGAIEMTLYAINEAYLSGFLEYVKLLMSDSDVTFSSWHAFAYSLFATAPALPAALVCVLLLACVVALARGVSNVRIITGHAVAA